LTFHKPIETQIHFHFSSHFNDLHLLTEASGREEHRDPKFPSWSFTNLCQNSISDDPKYQESLRKLTSN